MKRCFSLILTFLFLASALAPLACAGGGVTPFRGYVALTFDDGPSGEITQSLLDVLQAREIEATFFVCAYRVAQFPETLRRCAREGHEIGLHSCCHSYMHEMDYREAADDLTRCIGAVSSCCGVRATLFRPPGGLYSDTLTEAARDAGLSVILWSVDPQDWDPNNKSDIAQSVIEAASPGAILLMHDLYPRTVRAVGRIIDTLRARGYEFCTVSELAAYSGAELTPGGVYRSFSSPAD